MDYHDIELDDSGPQGPFRRSFVCPRCDRPSSSLAHGVAYWDGFDTTGFRVGPEAEYVFLQCEACSAPLVQWREDYGRGFDEDEPTFMYPAPHLLNAEIPSDLRREWTEAQLCFTAKAYTASTVMVRRALEATCVDQGVTSGVLAERLKELREAGRIDERLPEWATLLKDLGNTGAHAGAFVSREDAADGLAFLEASSTTCTCSVRDSRSSATGKAARTSTP